MKKITLIVFTLFLITIIPINVFAEQSTDEQIEELRAEVEEKVSTLNGYEDDLETLKSNISSLESKKVILKKDKEELKEKIKKSEKYVKNYLCFLQRMENTKLLLRILTNDNFLPSLYQILRISNFISNDFKELLSDVNELEAKEIEYEQTLTILTNDKAELEKKIKELEEVYKDLNTELVELEKISDFENLYDDNAKISQDEQEDIMKEAGIKEEDYDYVDYIVTKESTWNYTATNPLSGAYGLCQSLPPEKMKSQGDDWRDNPVTQLKWCNLYAESRYGSWEGAQEFWKENYWW